MNINFNEKKEVKSQQTLVNILKNKKYKFVRISDYDDNNFYLMLEMPICNKTSMWFAKYFRWLGFKYVPKFTLYPMRYSFYDCEDKYVDVEIVFTREDVLNIIVDVPENYIGEPMI